MYVAGGGAIGASSRYFFSLIYKYYFPQFPFGTLIINFIGSLLIGVLVNNIDQKESLTPLIKYFLIIGFLGSFTTFSTFSLEAIEMINDKKNNTIFNICFFISNTLFMWYFSGIEFK